MKETPGSSETSVLTRATRRNNPEDTILHSHRRENLKSYINYGIWKATCMLRTMRKNCEWCGEFCFAIAAILIGEFLQHNLQAGQA
jgi:hypothetical protein